MHNLYIMAGFMYEQPCDPRIGTPMAAPYRRVSQTITEHLHTGRFILILLSGAICRWKYSPYLSSWSQQRSFYLKKSRYFNFFAFIIKCLAFIVNTYALSHAERNKKSRRQVLCNISFGIYYVPKGQYFSSIKIHQQLAFFFKLWSWGACRHGTSDATGSTLSPK